jgi:hypothetical protein
MRGFEIAGAISTSTARQLLRDIRSSDRPAGERLNSSMVDLFNLIEGEQSLACSHESRMGAERTPGKMPHRLHSIWLRIRTL